MAGEGEVCGALTGALMALGEASQQQMALDPVAGRKAVRAQGLQLMDAFRAVHASILCRELTQCNLNTEAGQKDFQQRGLREKLCAKLVVFATEKTQQILAEAVSQQAN